MVADKVPLTVCPLSNIKLCVFDEMKNHNYRELLRKGLITTINSDDPAYFGGYINQNFLETAEALGLTKEELAQSSKNAFNASFISDDIKKSYCAQVDALM